MYYTLQMINMPFLWLTYEMRAMDYRRCHSAEVKVWNEARYVQEDLSSRWFALGCFGYSLAV